MRLTFTSKLFGGILGIAALIASTTPFWLFSSEEQVTYEQLKEKRVSLAAKTDIASPLLMATKPPLQLIQASSRQLTLL